MAIITQTMLESRVGSAELIRLTDDAGSSAVNATVLAQVVADAEGEVLGLVGQVWTLPLVLTDASTASLVKAKLLDAAIYRLYMRRDRMASDNVTALYKAAIDWATRVAEGKIGLAGESQRGSAVAAGGKIFVQSNEATITRDSMQGL